MLDEFLDSNVLVYAFTTDARASKAQQLLERAERYGLSVFDGLVVAAAVEAGCATPWSEDMHHGLVIDERLKILNPFIESDPGTP